MYRQFALIHSSMSRVVLSLSPREDALEQSLHHEHLIFPHLPQLLATMRGEREQMLHSLHTYQFGQSSSPLSVTLFCCGNGSRQHERWIRPDYRTCDNFGFWFEPE